MKFLFIFLFSLISNTFTLDQDKTRVLMIGLDGLFKKCLNKTDHTAFDYFMKEGSYSLKVRTAIEAMSASGWSQILCGIDSEDSGITSNEWWAPWMYGNKAFNVTPITGVDEPFPCVFAEIKKQRGSTAKTKMANAWDWFINIGNISIPGSLDEEIFCLSADGSLEDGVRCDIENTQHALRFIREDFDLIFLHYNSIDEAGHIEGFCSQDYIDRVSNVNRFIHMLLDELKDKGVLENTFVILCADHGAENGTKWHGEWDDDNLTVPFFVMGPGVKKGYQIKSYMNNLDIPATVLNLMGLTPNPLWRSKPIIDFLNKNKLK
jgi:predicted AlkP superfamily pyrophosphatase or phosphodiesterase